MRPSIQGIWAGLPQLMPGGGAERGMEGRDGDCWQLFHKWHFRTDLSVMCASSGPFFLPHQAVTQSSSWVHALDLIQLPASWER